VQHVHAELEVMSEADENNEWVVKLHYSFQVRLHRLPRPCTPRHQPRPWDASSPTAHAGRAWQDEEFLYLVMEYIPGGDMMSLLMKRDVLTEEETRFYAAQTILAIESLHTRGYIHRDLKPDNLLLDLEGHIKLSDFGLVKSLAQTKLKFYTPGGAGTLSNSGADGDEGGSALEQMSAEQKEGMHAWEGMSRRERMATWNRNRKAVIWSTVGTPDYMAPEILFEIGYNKDCDWWSLGVVVYEMLVGYPPFYGDDPLVTCRKILCFKETLQFPPEAPLSPHAESLIRSLLCDREERLGKEGADQIKRHPFFDGIDWSSLREPGAAPFKPQVDSATDTSHFDKFEERPPGEPGAPGSKDHDLAFLGYQYKRYPSCSDSVLNAISETADGEPGAAQQQPARYSAGSSSVSPVATSPRMQAQAGTPPPPMEAPPS
jgi:serine/threonine kinase 38